MGGVGVRGRGDARLDGEEGGVVVAEGERADGGDGGAVQAHVDEALVRPGRGGARHGGDGDAHLLRGDGRRGDARGVRRERGARRDRVRHRVRRERDAARPEWGAPRRQASWNSEWRAWRAREVRVVASAEEYPTSRARAAGHTPTRAGRFAREEMRAVTCTSTPARASRPRPATALRAVAAPATMGLARAMPTMRRTRADRVALRATPRPLGPTPSPAARSSPLATSSRFPREDAMRVHPARGAPPARRPPPGSDPAFRIKPNDRSGRFSPRRRTRADPSPSPRPRPPFPQPLPAAPPSSPPPPLPTRTVPVSSASWVSRTDASPSPSSAPSS